MKTRLVAATAVCGLAAAVMAGPVSPAEAVGGACSGAPAAIYADYETTGTPTLDYGSQSQIMTRDAVLCTGSNSSETIEFTSLSTADNGQYVAAGYGRTATSGGIRYWAGWNLGSGPQELLWAAQGPAPGVTHTYTVQYNASGNYEILGFDYTAMANKTVNFASGGWQVGRAHHYGAQVNFSNSGVAGYSTNQVTNSQLKVQQPYHTCCDAVTQNLAGYNYISGSYLGPLYLDGFISYQSS